MSTWRTIRHRARRYGFWREPPLSSLPRPQLETAISCDSFCCAHSALSAGLLEGNTRSRRHTSSHSHKHTHTHTHSCTHITLTRTWTNKHILSLTHTHMHPSESQVHAPTRAPSCSHVCRNPRRLGPAHVSFDATHHGCCARAGCEPWASSEATADCRWCRG